MKNGNSKGEINTLKKKIKYIFRNIFYFKFSKEIANFLMNDKYLSKEVYRYPVLCSKIHRPYITNSYEMKEKVDIIISSYKFLENSYNENFLKELYEKVKIKICEIEGKNNEKLVFYFSIFTDFEKEGEFNLICNNSLGNQLAKLTFAIDKGNSIIIGGLQGMVKIGDTEEIKQATKNFYGLFPKRLLIELLYSLFSDNKKIAVGNEGHIYLSLRYKLKKTRKINADYDEFWESLGASKRDKVFWSLPKILIRKNIEDIESKKRSQYRNRYKILDDLKILVYDFKNKIKK